VIPYGRWCSIALRSHKELYTAFNFCSILNIVFHRFARFCVYVCVSAMLLPATTIAEGEAIIREALSQANNPHHSAVTCTAGTFAHCLSLCLYFVFLLSVVV